MASMEVDKASDSKEEKMEIDDAEKVLIVESEDEVDFKALLKNNINTLVKGVELDDRNLIRRVWRRNTAIRNEMSLYDFQELLPQYIPKGDLFTAILGFLDVAVKAHEESTSGVGKNRKTETTEKVEDAKKEPLMEVETYLSLFIVSSLMKYKKYEEAITVCEHILSRVKFVKRQTLDTFAAKTYSALSLASERQRGFHYEEKLLSELLSGQKTAALRLYEQCQATVVNLILRRYIKDKMYAKARMFINATTDVPLLDSSNVGNNEQIKYLYYFGKVSAVEGNYSDSEKYLTRAISKCPTNTALGFRIVVNKLSIVTKLLIGEIPERQLFLDTEMSKELEPYFFLVKSVRTGSVADYDSVVVKYKDHFERDDQLTLIDRLRSSVIKTALRNINLAYSKIGFKDIMNKLELKTEKDAELVCAKAIRDQIIENAVIDSSKKILLSTETVDVYSTTLDPKLEFNRRIKFLLGLHNAALKAHKYPPNSHKPNKEVALNLDEENIDDIDFDDFFD